MMRSSVLGLVCSALLVTAAVGSASAATPLPTRASIETRTFNDCPLSVLTVTNNYPGSSSDPSTIEIIDEMNPLCVGFANLHSWSFSTDGGATAATFPNRSSFKYGADVTLFGAGEGEGGLRISPWYGPFVDGRFMLNVTSGEIACFGGRLPFYSFTANHGVTYTRNTTVRMDITVLANGLSAASPATIQYRLTSGANAYESPALPFDMANPAEDPPHGLWGILNDARVGGYFQPRANTGASLRANWHNIDYTILDDPTPNSASVEQRTFNDCPLSVLTTTNNYPSLVSITDEMSSLCVGFANLHSWSFSEDGGATAAVFSNSSQFSFGADVTIAGAGEGEGGLRLSPWFGPFVDGRFMLNVTSGEIACFGGRLPFYSFTSANGLHYTRGTTVRMGITYRPDSLTAGNPGTIQYSLTSGGVTTTSPVLPFDMANPNEDPPYGLWGILNGARVGGYFQPRANTGAALTASWGNITFSRCPAKAELTVIPHTINTRSHLKHVLAFIQVPGNNPAEIDQSSLRLNGVPASGPGIVIPHYFPGLITKFSRAALIATFVPGSIQTLTLTGEVGGDCFVTTDQVKVKPAIMAAPSAGATLAGGSTAGVTWEPDPEFTAVDMVLSGDGGETWSVVQRDVPNNGSYSWMVPGVTTDQALFGVAKVGEDENGDIMLVDELSESNLFQITSPLAVGGGALEFAVRGVSPNPARGSFKVDFTLPSASPASIGVFDVAGRQVESREIASAAPGNHSVEFGRSRALPAGLYIVRLSQSGRTLTARAVVTR